MEEMYERVLHELNYEEEVTARLYALGYEKKEIAEIKCRAVSTVNNQLQSAFLKMNVKNGRVLTNIICERLSGMKFSFDLYQARRICLSVFLLAVFSLTFVDKTPVVRARRTRTEKRVRRDSEDSAI